MPETPAPESALDQAVKWFYPGDRARDCGDDWRADTYDAAVSELATLRQKAALADEIAEWFTGKKHMDMNAETAWLKHWKDLQ